jgi:hypothetical protein
MGQFAALDPFTTVTAIRFETRWFVRPLGAFYPSTSRPVPSQASCRRFHAANAFRM